MGQNTITFSTLPPGTYIPTITVTDADGKASTLTATSFVVDVIKIKGLAGEHKVKVDEILDHNNRENKNILR